MLGGRAARVRTADAHASRTRGKKLMRLGNMSVVASQISQLSYRLDALYAKVGQMATESSSGPNASGDAGESHDETPDWAPRQHVDDAVSELRSLIDDVKGAQANGLRKERGVLEAVITQKMDKRLGEKVQEAVADKAPKEPALTKPDLDKVLDRVNKIAAEVDRQAKFLVSIDTRIRDAVDRAIKQERQERQDKTTGAAPEQSGASGSTTQLEDAPALDAEMPALQQTNASDDADEIDMVKSDDKDKKKPTPAARKKK